MNDWLDLHPDPVHVTRERAKARLLRQSPWWKQQLRSGVCHYCHKEVGPDHLTMDHVIPISRGGKSTRANCVPCCAACNATKKSYTPAEQILKTLFPEDTIN